MQSVNSDTRLEKITRTVVVEGLRPIMFDRYAGDNDTRLTWQEKIYLAPGTNRLVLPIANVLSFYTAHNTNSAPKRLRDARKYKTTANAIQSYVQIDHPEDQSSEYLDFKRDGKVIEVGNFKGPDESDVDSQLWMHRSVARLDKGIPNPKERPVLPLPWSLAMSVTIYANNAIKEAEIRNLMIEGGIAIGFGTYRGVYGKFDVTKWE